MGLQLVLDQRVRRSARRAAFLILTSLAATIHAVPASPQGISAERADSDSEDALSDAVLATPNQTTPVPQDDLYATAPGAEQNASPTRFTLNIVMPLKYNSNATESNKNGDASGEADPDIRLTYTTQVGGSNVRLTVQLRADSEYYGLTAFRASQNVNFLRAEVRAQYVDPSNDQAFSPYIAIEPRWSYDPLYATRFANRQDLNLGLQKRFNFDGNFVRVPAAGNTAPDTVWSFGLNLLAQHRCQSPFASSNAMIAALSTGYSFSPQWGGLLALVLTRRWFDQSEGLPRGDFTIEPVLTIERTLPSRWFGYGAGLLGNPAIDFEVAGKQQYSSIINKEFTTLFVGIALKMGVRF